MMAQPFSIAVLKTDFKARIVQHILSLSLPVRIVKILNALHALTGTMATLIVALASRIFLSGW
jgi:hypothetical protein